MVDKIVYLLIILVSIVGLNAEPETEIGFENRSSIFGLNAEPETEIGFENKSSIFGLNAEPETEIGFENKSSIIGLNAEPETEIGIGNKASIVGLNAEPETEIGFERASNNPDHYLVVGERQSGDHLGLAQNVIKSAEYGIVTVDQNFRVYERITQISAFDRQTNGKGATASLLSGGPGYTDATIRFQSQPGYGIDFVLELYSIR